MIRRRFTRPLRASPPASVRTPLRARNNSGKKRQASSKIAVRKSVQNVAHPKRKPLSGLIHRASTKACAKSGAGNRSGGRNQRKADNAGPGKGELISRFIERLYCKLVPHFGDSEKARMVATATVETVASACLYQTEPGVLRAALELASRAPRGKAVA